LQPLLCGRKEDGLAGSLDLGERRKTETSGYFYTFDVVQIVLSYSVQEVAPALRLLRRLDRLDEDEAGTELFEGAYPVGAVEDEVTVFVRGDYYGVALLTLSFDAPPQAVQAVVIVGLMEDEAFEVDEEEVFEGGDHVPGGWLAF
jgi:hypothetical protein